MMISTAADAAGILRGVTRQRRGMRVENRPARHRQDRARSTHSGARTPIRASNSWPAPAATPPSMACRTSGSRDHARRGPGPGLRFHLHAAAGAFRRGADGAARRQTRDAREAADRHHAADRVARRRSRAPRAHAVPDLAFAVRRGRRCGARMAAHAQAAARQDHLEGRRAPLASGPALDLGAGRLRRVRSGHQRVVGAHRDPAEGSLRRSAHCSNFRRISRRRSRRSCDCAPKTASRSRAEFDFRQKGEQSWDIELATTTGTLKLVARRRRALHRRQGRDSRRSGMAGEYPRLYRAFRRAVRCAASRKSTGGRSSSSRMRF